VSPVAPAVSTSSPRLASGATASSKESAELQRHARCIADGRAPAQAIENVVVHGYPPTGQARTRARCSSVSGELRHASGVPRRRCAISLNV
jgi:hypothetical protein